MRTGDQFVSEKIKISKNGEIRISKTITRDCVAPNHKLVFTQKAFFLFFKVVAILTKLSCKLNSLSQLIISNLVVAGHAALLLLHHVHHPGLLLLQH